MKGEVGLGVDASGSGQEQVVYSLENTMKPQEQENADIPGTS
jgi:hypothetical protein